MEPRYIPQYISNAGQHRIMDTKDNRLLTLTDTAALLNGMERLTAELSTERQYVKELHADDAERVLINDELSQKIAMLQAEAKAAVMQRNQAEDAARQATRMAREVTAERDKLREACEELVERLDLWLQNSECSYLDSECETCQQGKLAEGDNDESPSVCDACGEECNCTDCWDLQAIRMAKAALFPTLAAQVQPCPLN